MGLRDERTQQKGGQQTAYLCRHCVVEGHALLRLSVTSALKIWPFNDFEITSCLGRTRLAFASLLLPLSSLFHSCLSPSYDLWTRRRRSRNAAPSPSTVEPTNPKCPGWRICFSGLSFYEAPGQGEGLHGETWAPTPSPRHPNQVNAGCRRG